MQEGVRLHQTFECPTVDVEAGVLVGRDERGPRHVVIESGYASSRTAESGILRSLQQRTYFCPPKACGVWYTAQDGITNNTFVKPLPTRNTTAVLPDRHREHLVNYIQRRCAEPLRGSCAAHPCFRSGVMLQPQFQLSPTQTYISNGTSLCFLQSSSTRVLGKSPKNNIPAQGR